MRILIVGNGGREHALLWKLRRDAPGAEFFATRPNGGMAPLCQAVDIAPGDVDALAGWAADREVDLTVVGPEAPLAAGIVDAFEARELPIFGPSASAARIEASKAYAKQLLQNANVPTAGHRTFTEEADAVAYVRQEGAPIVVKASGLAAGKGAVVCMTEDEAVTAIEAMMGDLRFGDAGREVVVEEFMEGEELSVFAICDGTDFVLLQASQDHKRVGEGEAGPNTGGMGAYAPVSIADEALLDEAVSEIIAPTVKAMADDGAPFKGLLYAGLMNTADGLKVVEFNCRFGDPETQVVLPLMESSLLELMRAVAGGESIAACEVVSKDAYAVTTVLASGGYPGSYEKGKEIYIPDDLEGDDVLVFHAGTERRDDTLVTSGGRVLAVTAIAPTFSSAASASRNGAAAIDFEGAFFRADIGWRERARREEA
ncbi:MAG: phosphoribosylamine--glycine ligase [Longimicrobiales bacterium]|nr:phosphoribosylamine--glycine ligase [Longimicrobiales bacterium]